MPDGINAKSYATELDKIISEGNHSTILVGGIYQNWCVADVANNTQSRNPDSHVKIARDISFDNNGAPTKCYKSIPQTTLEEHL